MINQQIESNKLMDEIVSLCKRRGFVFPGSEIYGGFAGTYDFGPYGFELRQNIKQAWISAMKENDNMAMLDSSIFTAPRVWEASGHVSGFADPLVICLECKSKFRADHLIESVGAKADEKMSEEEINKIFDTYRPLLKCPKCGRKKFSQVRAKKMLATSTLGVMSEEDKETYLRAETAQGIYINYKNILNTGFYSVPFGIAQVGKAFRNEISPRQFLFRLREFEQMEMQYFVHPRDAISAYEEWKERRMSYYINLGFKKEKLRWKKHDNLVFYAKDAWDIEYEFPFGWGELEGVHYRGDYDLTQHQKFSGVDMSVVDEKTKSSYIPHVVETSVGVDRTFLALLSEAYSEDEMNGERRVFLKFPPKLAPVKVAVFPLLRNKPDLVNKAKEIYFDLKKHFINKGLVKFDDNGNIGKRYRRQDEIGTPYCVTVDFETLEKGDVTIRYRDTGRQERIKIEDIKEYVEKSNC